MNQKRIIGNLSFAFTAQIFSLALSFTMNLVVPKLLGVTEYSYWQLFTFYASYVGFFHLGLNDGVYLLQGGTEYKKLDKPLVASQFRFGVVMQLVMAVFIVGGAFVFVQESQRVFVLCASAVYLLLYNFTLYLGYLFQACNETKLYSISIMIDKVVFLVAIIALLVFKISRFEVYVVLYNLAMLCALIYCLYKGRDVLRAKNLPLRQTVREALGSIKVGINLMLANIASMLILGFGRFTIDLVWGIEAFGKFSFAISLTNTFLLFISQVSMVLFPALRQSSEKEIQKFYVLARDVLTVILPLAYVAYIPLRIILGAWLPQYKVSLEYMALLLPLCNYNGKMNLLCITYFKVLRKEKFLLKVNVITMALSVALSLFGAYVLHSIYFIVVSMVVATAFRSVVSELYLAKLMQTNVTGVMLQEIALSVLFMATAWLLQPYVSFGVIVAAYGVFLLVNRKRVSGILGTARSVVKKLK